jgi:erythromycin esterase
MVVFTSCTGTPSEASATDALLIPETEDQNFVEWARLDASPIESLTPGDEFGGLESLGEIVGDARIVAVGEPVYGAREVALLKRRMFEYLVQNRGVRTIVAEVGWSEALAIDEYIHTGRGNPEALLTEVRTWTWNTSEALDLVRWMRRYNENVPRSRQLHFLGVDMIYTSAAASALRTYLQEVDQEFLSRIDDTL